MKLYIGCTNNLKDRVKRHKNGQVKSTKDIRPVKLIFYACFSDKYLAYNFEKYLKSGSGRAFTKKHLINIK
jgi:predicted GIY-YIG superfamily endonuclease